MPADADRSYDITWPIIVMAAILSALLGILGTIWATGVTSSKDEFRRVSESFIGKDAFDQYSRRIDGEIAALQSQIDEIKRKSNLR